MDWLLGYINVLTPVAVRLCTHHADYGMAKIFKQRRRDHGLG